MKRDKKAMTLYAVTDRAWVGKQSLYEQVESALKGGATCVQLREKELGEEAFLAEAMELAALCKRSGLVIATGGGCVTREENLDILRQNGRIFWLQRDLELLPTDGRPLSQMNKLEDLYSKREPLYRKWSDHIIDNHGAESLTVERILTILEGNS